MLRRYSVSLLILLAVAFAYMKTHQTFLLVFCIVGVISVIVGLLVERKN